MRAIAPHHPFGRANTSATDRAMQPAEDIASCIDRLLYVGLVCHVGLHETRTLAKLGGDGIAGLGVDIGDDDSRAMLSQQTDCGRAQPRPAAADQKDARLDLHIVSPLRL